jgi:hypothetical protein
MMKSSFSRLAVLGLAVISGQVFAAVNISGELRLDAGFPSKPSADTNTLDLSRVRLQAKADLAQDWVAGLRLDKVNDKVELKRAYVSWTGLENNSLTLGKYSHISTNADDAYYAPYITAHGIVSGFNQSGLGASMSGSMGYVGYNVGVINTPADATSKSLEGSFGARVHFTPMKTDTMCWGLGLGMLEYKDNKSFEVNASRDLTEAEKAGSEGILKIFKDFQVNTSKYRGMTADLSGAMGRFSASLSYAQRKDKVGTPVASTLTGDPVAAKDSVTYGEKEGPTYASLNVATQTLANALTAPTVTDGKTQSYCAEVAYLVMGDGYKMENAVLTGPSFSDSALELGLRVSQFEREGAALALAYNSPVSASVNTAFLNQKHKKRTFSVFANYYVNSNATIKLEYLDSTIKDGAGALVATTGHARDETGKAINGGEQRKFSARAEFKF